MTEEQARTNAKALALGMGIIFYVVRSREGRILPVQLPSDDCEVDRTTQRCARSRVGVNLILQVIRASIYRVLGTAGNRRQKTRPSVRRVARKV
jgi:hypothetical protein